MGRAGVGNGGGALEQIFGRRHFRDGGWNVQGVARELRRAVGVVWSGSRRLLARSLVCHLVYLQLRDVDSHSHQDHTKSLERMDKEVAQLMELWEVVRPRLDRLRLWGKAVFG